MVEKFGAALAAAIFLIIVLANLAWMALLGWGVYELVEWIITK